MLYGFHRGMMLLLDKSTSLPISMVVAFVAFFSLYQETPKDSRSEPRGLNKVKNVDQYLAVLLSQGLLINSGFRSDSEASQNTPRSAAQSKAERTDHNPFVFAHRGEVPQLNMKLSR